MIKFSINRNQEYSVTSIQVMTLFLLVMSLMANRAAGQVSKLVKPNIILILIDDAGYADFGFMGSKDLLTPNIDQLAGKSIRFSDGHVTASVCSPSRAGILTGKYQQRFGYECNEGVGYTGMDTGQTLLPKLLLQAGYTTAAFGKWHLGFEPGQHPLKNGFQYYYGFLSGGRSYFYRPDKDDRKGSKSAILENNIQVSFEGYLTDVLGNKAADFIHRHKNTPFFMYWAPNAVHTPMDAAKEDLDKFAKHPRQTLAAMTYALDRSVGNIMTALRQEKLLDNTLIFFLSDNGGAHNNQSSNFPLTGFKGNKFEAGHRIPFLVHWPEQWKGGNDFDGLSSSLDIFPTVLDAAGLTISNRKEMDGVSLLPYLKNEKKGHPHEQLVWRKDGAAAIRFQSYKLISVKGVGDRLYDLSRDIEEKEDLRSQNPVMHKMLKEKLAEWEKDKMLPLWREGAEWDSITNMIHEDLMNQRKVRVRNPEELKKFRLSKKEEKF